MLKKTKLTELENNIPDVSSLATKSALTAVENKMPNVSSLVKKTNYDTKISELKKKLTDHNHDNYINTAEFNTLVADIFNARLVQANLITRQISMLNRQVLTEKLLQINQNIYLLKMSWKAKNIWFKLFYWQTSFWRRWYTKLFSISANVQIF